MTDIFARKPAPIPANRVLAPRYDIFISAFEKVVAEAQKRIEKIRGMETLYSIAKDALESVKLRNDHKLVLEENAVTISIQAVKTDSIKTFENLVGLIGAKLKARDLHADGEASVGDLATMRSWRFWVRGNRSKINIDVEVPFEGLTDLEVIRSPVTYTYDAYTMRPRQARHQHRARGACVRRQRRNHLLRVPCPRPAAARFATGALPLRGTMTRECRASITAPTPRIRRAPR